MWPGRGYCTPVVTDVAMGCTLVALMQPITTLLQPHVQLCVTNGVANVTNNGSYQSRTNLVPSATQWQHRVAIMS